MIPEIVKSGGFSIFPDPEFRTLRVLKGTLGVPSHKQDPFSCEGEASVNRKIGGNMRKNEDAYQ
jgi:hypothetical protein